MIRIALSLLVLAAPAALAQKTPPKATLQAPAQPAASPAAAVGAWNYVIEMPDQQIAGALTIEATPTGFKGSIVTDGARRLESIVADGAMLGATFEQPGFGTVTLAATVDEGSVLTGTVSAGGESYPITATQAVAQPDLVGAWRYELDAPDGSRPFGTFEFTESGGVLKGRVVGFATSPMESIGLAGDALRLTFTPRGYARVTVEATVDGDTMRGTFSGTDPEAGPMTLPLTATRQTD